MGKSFIGFQLAADHPEASVCWLSPSEYIFRIQLKNWSSALASVSAAASPLKPSPHGEDYDARVTRDVPGFAGPLAVDEVIFSAESNLPTNINLPFRAT